MTQEFYLWVFILRQLVIAKIWKQPRYSFIDEWIMKMWYILK